MTREEKISHMINQFKMVHPTAEDKELQIWSDAVRVMYDAMEHDFESRTCENCKHGTRHKQKSLLETERIFCEKFVTEELGRELNSRLFGCNKFERKDT